MWGGEPGNEAIILVILFVLCQIHTEIKFRQSTGEKNNVDINSIPKLGYS